MAVIRMDIVEVLDDDEQKEIIHQILSLYVETGPDSFGEAVANVLLSRGLVTFEDAVDEESDL